jgi:hypothetical protein
VDEASYLELRDKVRARHHQDLSDQDFLIRFISALAHRANVLVGGEKAVCTPGSMTGTNFVPREYDALGSSVGFALNFEFRDEKGRDLLDVPVRFVAKCHPESFSVRCTDTGDEVDQPRSAASTEEGQLAVFRILDRALRMKVESALQKPDLT